MPEESKSIAEFKIGEVITTHEFTISDDMIERYIAAVGDYNPWYTQNSPFSGRIVPPMLISNYTTRAVVSRLRKAGLHAKQEVELINPAKPGMKLIMVIKLADRYEKREQEFVIIESVSRDENGIEIIRAKATVRI